MAQGSGSRDSLTGRIHRVYGDLPAGERKAADFVLDRPGELAVYAANELATRVGVSNATVSRFFKRLGYESYDDARVDSRRMRASGSPLYLTEENGRQNALSAHLAVEADIVATTLSMLNPETLRAATEAVAKARRVRIAGFRNSYFAAEYARNLLAQIRPDVAMLTRPGQTLAEGVAELNRGDVAIVLGFRRRVARFNDFVAAVEATGAEILLLSDRSVREAPLRARWTITCAVETPQALDSYSGAMAVLRLIALDLIRQLGADARSLLQKIEQTHELLDELE